MNGHLWLPIAVSLCACGVPSPDTAARPAAQSSNVSSHALSSDVTWICRDATGRLSKTAGPALQLSPSKLNPQLDIPLRSLLVSARGCTEKAALAEHRGILSFDIDTRGDAPAASLCISPSVGLDPGLASCVADALTALRVDGPPIHFASSIDLGALPAGGASISPATPLPERCEDGPLPPPTVASTQPPDASPPSTSMGGEGSIQGALISDVENALKLARTKSRECYQHALRNAPTLYGRLAFKMDIAADGSVKRTCTSSRGLNEAMRGCVTDNLRALSFEAPKGGAAHIQGAFTFLNHNVAEWPWPTLVR